MEKVNSSIAWVTGGLLIFTILCSPLLSVPFALLFYFLILLQAGLIWMVLTILKEGKASGNTFNEKFYDDCDLGPHQNI